MVLRVRILLAMGPRFSRQTNNPSDRLDQSNRGTYGDLFNKIIPTNAYWIQIPLRGRFCSVEFQQNTQTFKYLRNHQGINDASQYQSWSVSWKIWMTRTSSRVSRLNWNEVLECWMLGYEHCTTGLYLRYQLLDTDIMNWILYDDINLCMLKTEWKLWMKNVGCSVSNCIWYSIIIILILTLRLQLYPPTPTQTELKGSHKKKHFRS